MRIPVFVVLLAFTVPSMARAACDTPRQAVSSWIDNLQIDNDRPQLAIDCFDWSAGPATTGDRVKRARELLAVLDGRGLYVLYDTLPDVAEPEESQSRYLLFPAQPEIALERIADRWVVSRGTIRETPQLFRSTYRVPLQRWAQTLPKALHGTALTIKLWQWLAMLSVLGLGLLIGFLAQRILGVLFRRVLGRALDTWDETLEWRSVRRAGWVVGSSAPILLLPSIGLGARLNKILLLPLKAVMAAAFVLLVVAVLDLVFDVWERRASGTKTRMDDQLIPLLRRSAKLVALLLGLLFVLQNLGIDVTSLVAGLGLGGLAFALAAQNTLAHLFGSLTIFADRPFQIGDWVSIGDVEGTVEEIGFRSTRIRTFYDSVVTLPNSDVAEARVDNMGRRRRRRFKLLLKLTHQTPPDRVQAFVEGVRASIQASPYTLNDNYEVHLNGLSEHSLDILVYSFFDVTGWTDELKGRHHLILEWLRLAEDLGVRFAHPTWSVELARDEAGRPHELGEEQLRAIVDAFGPGGERALPGGRPLTEGWWPGTDSGRGS